MKDGSRGEDEDDEVEEVGSPQKRKWAGTDKGSRDKKGKQKMMEAEWETESRWRDRVEARLESMDSVLQKIVVMRTEFFYTQKTTIFAFLCILALSTAYLRTGYASTQGYMSTTLAPSYVTLPRDWSLFL